MDFVGPFPECQGYDYLWVIICRLTNQTHLTPITVKTTMMDLAWCYIRDIVRLHGMPESIVSDRDSKFTSRFWRELHRLLGVKLLMSTLFHPQTDGHSERVICSIGQILRSTVSPDQKDWLPRIPLVEFTLNSSINSSSGFTPFKLNYGYMPRVTPFPSDDIKYRGVKKFAQRACTNIEMAHDAIIEAHVSVTYQANWHRAKEKLFQIGDMAYLSTINLNLPKRQARKLALKYIGPFKVTNVFPESSNYELELSEGLIAWRIHPKFHILLLRPFSKPCYFNTLKYSNCHQY